MEPTTPEEAADEAVRQFAEFVLTHPNHPHAEGIEVAVGADGTYAFRSTRGIAGLPLDFPPIPGEEML